MWQVEKLRYLCALVRVEVFPIIDETGLCTPCLFNLFTIGSYFALGTDAFFLENGLFLFQLHNLVVKFCLVQQICIAGKDSHELGEVHAVVLVHAALVDTAHGDCAVIDLVDEHLLVFQQIEFVGVKCLFRAVYHHIHHIAAPQLHGVALAYRPAVALLHVGRSPGNLQMMHRYRPLLGVYPCA